MSNFKEYLKLICEGDITSVRAKMQAKQRGLVHQSHDIWKDKSGQKFWWNGQSKKFEEIGNFKKGDSIKFVGIDTQYGPKKREQYFYIKPAETIGHSYISRKHPDDSKFSNFQDVLNANERYLKKD